MSIAFYNHIYDFYQKEQHDRDYCKATKLRRINQPNDHIEMEEMGSHSLQSSALLIKKALGVAIECPRFVCQLPQLTVKLANLSV